MIAATKTKPLLILLVLKLSTCKAEWCARNVVFDSEHNTAFDKDREQYVKVTTVSFSIGRGETVCFTVRDKDQVGSEGRKYSFTFESVESIYNFKNTYLFALAVPQVKCLCDCPGAEKHCSPERASCWEDGWGDSEHCFDYYESYQRSQGCGLLEWLGQADVCCSVSIKQRGGQVYKAFELSDSSVRATFSVRREEGVRQTQHINLETGSSVFPKLEDDYIDNISFDNPGNIDGIPDGWYYGSADGNDVRTNLEVNGLGEWDVNKLGWYKLKEGNPDFNRALVKQAFRGQVERCNSDDIEVTFASKFIKEDSLSEGRTISDFHGATIEEAIRDNVQRTVTLKYHSFSRISARIVMRGEKEVKQEYTKPSFEDFSAYAFLDKHSNRYINVTIMAGQGTLHGIMRVAGKHDIIFDVIVSGALTSLQKSQAAGVVRNTTQIVEIIGWCNEDKQAELCLHTNGRDLKCRVISCLEQEQDKFIAPNNTINYETSDKSSIFSADTWTKYLNPLGWFEGIDDWQEGVVMVVTILVVLVCVGVTAKICKMLGCMVSCCRCLTKCCRRNRHKVKVTKQHTVSGVKRPETLTIVKSPRPLRKLSELNLLDTPRFQSPRSAETVDYASLHTSMFGSNGSYLNLTRSAALARKEAEVKSQAKRQFEARHKYQRLRSVSVGEIGSQSCPLEEHQLSSSMCHLPSAPPRIWVLSPKASLGAFPTTSADVHEVNDFSPKKTFLRHHGILEYMSSPNHSYRSNQHEIVTDIKSMFLPAESQEFEEEGLGEPTPDSSVISSPSESGKEQLCPADNSESQLQPGRKPVHLELPAQLMESLSPKQLNLPIYPQRTVSSSPLHQLVHQPRRLSVSRVSDGSIFRFDNIIPPPSFTQRDSSSTELNPLKQTMEYNGGTPPNSPLILSQVAEQFI